VRDVFFAARQVLEVETPILVNAPVTDVQIDSIAVPITMPDGVGHYLHASPEYAMKRLLAAGSGDIYQICRVFRGGGERGSLHNPEFTMIEWYRVGASLEALMQEVGDLVAELLGGAPRQHEMLSYADALARHARIDLFAASLDSVRESAIAHGLASANAGAASRDELLDFLMGTVVGPRLGHGALTFVHRYPKSQAALARVDPADSRVALRFELYADGIELANGFDELANAREQRERFEADRAERARRGLPDRAPDARLLAALESGLPGCAGVALGFDRVMMLARQAQRIDAVIAFPVETA
jgi:lysyl-tRNA synthetase class 2